jgi:hypothetical protein
MNLLAVALICSTGVPVAECTRTTADQVIVARVATPMECMMRGQIMAAGGALAEHLTSGSYLRVVCERERVVVAQPAQ